MAGQLGGLQQAAQAFGGYKSAEAALNNNYGPAAGYAANLAGASPAASTGIMGAVNALQGNTPAAAQSAITAMSQLAGYSPLSSLVSQVVGPAVASDLRGETGESTRASMADNAMNAGIGLLIANPLAAAAYAASRMAGVNPATAIRGTYSDALGSRVGGLLGDNVAFQMMDNVPAAYNMPGFFGTLKGDAPSFKGVMTNKGFLTPSMLQADVQEAAPVVDANLVSVDPSIAEAMAMDAREAADVMGPDLSYAPAEAAPSMDYSTPASYGDFGGYNSGFVSSGDAPFGGWNASDTAVTSPVADTSFAPSMDTSSPVGSWGGSDIGGMAGDSSLGGPGDGGVSGVRGGDTSGWGNFGGLGGWGGFGGDSGSSGGGGGSKVICTELHRQGKMPTAIFAADQRFGRMQDVDTMTGYHSWAIPLVKLMRKSPLVTQIVAMFATPWSKHMAYEMGAHSTDNLFGKVLMKTFKPVCKAIGFVINCRSILKGA